MTRVQMDERRNVQMDERVQAGQGVSFLASACYSLLAGRGEWADTHGVIPAKLPVAAVASC